MSLLQRPQACVAFLLLATWLSSACSKEQEGATSPPTTAGEAEITPADDTAPAGENVLPPRTAVGPPLEAAQGPEGRREEMPAATHTQGQDQDVPRASLTVLLPFGGKRDSYDFSKVQSYAVVVPFGFDETTGHDASGAVVLNKDADQPMVSDPGRLTASVKKHPLKGAISVEIQGFSRQDNRVKIAGFPKPLSSPRDAQMGDALFLLDLDIKAGPGVLHSINVATGKITKKEPVAPKTVSAAPPKGPGADERRIGADRAHANTSGTGSGLTYVSSIRPVDDRFFQEITDIAVNAAFVFVTTGPSQTLEIFDLWRKNSINRVGLYQATLPQEGQGKRNWNSDFHALAVRENVVYLLNSGIQAKEDLLAVSIKDPTRPSLLARQETGSEPYDLELAEDRLYVLTMKDLQVFDAAKPTSLRRLGDYPLKLDKDAILFDLELYQGRAFIAGFKSGLMVLDVSDPSHIKSTFHHASPRYLPAAKIHRDVLFVSEADTTGESRSTISVFSLQNPSSPELIHTIILPPHEGARSFSAQGDRLYVAIFPIPIDAPSGLQTDSIKVFDIRDPKRPSIVAGYTPKDRCSGSAVHAEGSHIFLGTLGCGVIILEDHTR